MTNLMLSTNHKNRLVPGTSAKGNRLACTPTSYTRIQINR